MANLFEACNNVHTFTKLQQVKDTYVKERESREQKEREEFEARHKSKHVFTSYEHALTWMELHPNKIVHWHSSDIAFVPEKNMYKAYEQEFDLDGINCWDVVNYYTREQMLQNHQEHVKYMKVQYTTFDESEFLDEYGKLAYVYI